MDGQNAVTEGTNPGHRSTTGGIDIWIYGANLPNGSTQDSARMLLMLSVLASSFGYLVLIWSLLEHHSVWPTILQAAVSKQSAQGSSQLFCEDPPPTLLLLVKVPASMSITSTSTKRKPRTFLLFAYLPPTQSRDSHPHPQSLRSIASSCLGTSCQNSEQPAREYGEGGRGSQGGGVSNHDIEKGNDPGLRASSKHAQLRLACFYYERLQPNPGPFCRHVWIPEIAQAISRMRDRPHDR